MRVLSVSLIFALAASGAAALEALVEEADPSTGLAAYSFLDVGAQVDLGASARLVLGYPATCMQETITGGTVTVGQGSSTVDGGRVKRVDLDCGGNTDLAKGSRQESGATAWRNVWSEPSQVVYNVAPFIQLSVPADALMIRRLDAPGRPTLIRQPGREVDLAKLGISLEPGATYRIGTGKRSRKMVVDGGARKSGGPAFTRLFRF